MHLIFINLVPYDMMYLRVFVVSTKLFINVISLVIHLKWYFCYYYYSFFTHIYILHLFVMNNGWKYICNIIIPTSQRIHNHLLNSYFYLKMMAL